MENEVALVALEVVDHLNADVTPVMVAAEAVQEGTVVAVMTEAAAEEDTAEAVEMITEAQEVTPTVVAAVVVEEATQVVVAAAEAVVVATIQVAHHAAVVIVMAEATQMVVAADMAVAEHATKKNFTILLFHFLRFFSPIHPCSLSLSLSLLNCQIIDMSK